VPAVHTPTSPTFVASERPRTDDLNTMEPLLVIAGLMIAVGLWYGTGLITRWLVDRRLSRATRGRGVLALTFDDGPGPNTTPALLDLLAKHDAKATFFLVGRCAEAAPRLTQRIAAEGHTIGWHSHRHRNQWKSNPVQAVVDVWRPPTILRSGETSVRVFRPPYGKMNLGTVLACLAGRLPIITWTHASGDTFATLPEVPDVVETVRTAGGGVVLMHDMDRDDASRAPWVLGLTEALLQLAHEKNWRIVATPTDWNALR
jgi:peptidoglycan/xylan/chitin deacetylase (PgdA/CDA1 family)